MCTYFRGREYVRTISSFGVDFLLWEMDTILLSPCIILAPFLKNIYDTVDLFFPYFGQIISIRILIATKSEKITTIVRNTAKI